MELEISSLRLSIGFTGVWFIAMLYRWHIHYNYSSDVWNDSFKIISNHKKKKNQLFVPLASFSYLPVCLLWWLLNVSSRSTGGGHLSRLLVSQHLLPAPLLFREWPTSGTPLPQEQPDAWLSQHGGWHIPSSASQSVAPSADSNSEVRNLRREAPVASELLVVWKQRHLMFGGSSGSKMEFMVQGCQEYQPWRWGLSGEDGAVVSSDQARGRSRALFLEALPLGSFLQPSSLPFNKLLCWISQGCFCCLRGTTTSAIFLL